MEERAVVTCFLRDGPEVLLCRRRDAVDTYPGRWDAVSGVVEGATGEAAGGAVDEEAARWVIDEAVGLGDAVEFVRAADPLEAEDETSAMRWLVHPSLFDCDSTAVDPEETLAEFQWVQPPEILDRETVPGLWESYRAVSPTVETVRRDDEHGSAFVSLRALEALRDRAAEVAAGAGADGDHATLAALARDLRDARPSMGVVATRVNRVMSRADATSASVREESIDACERAVRADREAAARAADVVGDRVLTLSRSGTVLEALRRADPEAVFVAESRPDPEGVGVAEELAESGLEVSLCVDAAVGHVLATAAVDTVVVGADAVLADGAVVNKVGTRLAALAAREADVDCYAVCSLDKIVPARSVDLESGPPGAVHGAPAAFEVLNPVFERTPARLLTGVVTEDGPLAPEAVATVAAEHAELAGWDA